MEEFTNFDLLIFKSALENRQTLHQSVSNSIIADFLTAISTKKDSYFGRINVGKKLPTWEVDRSPFRSAYLPNADLVFEGC